MNIGGKLSGDRNKNRDNSSPRGDTDPIETVDVAVSGNGSKVIVDMLEMQPIRSKNQNGDLEGNDSDSIDSHDRGSDRSSKGSSSIIFSKKYGISKSSSSSPTFSHMKKPNSPSGKQSSFNSDSPLTLNGKTPNVSQNLFSKNISEVSEDKNVKNPVISSSSLTPLSSSSSFQSVTSNFNHSPNILESSSRPKSTTAHIETSFFSSSTHSSSEANTNSSQNSKKDSNIEGLVKSNSYFSTQL